MARVGAPEPAEGEVVAWEGEGSGEGGVSGDGWLETGLDEPVDVGVGVAGAEADKNGHTAGHVAEGAGSDDENPAWVFQILPSASVGGGRDRSVFGSA